MTAFAPVLAPPRQVQPGGGDIAGPALGTGATAAAALPTPEAGAMATVADGQGLVSMQMGQGAGPDVAEAAALPPPQQVVGPQAKFHAALAALKQPPQANHKYLLVISAHLKTARFGRSTSQIQNGTLTVVNLTPPDGLGIGAVVGAIGAAQPGNVAEFALVVDDHELLPLWQAHQGPSLDKPKYRREFMALQDVFDGVAGRALHRARRTDDGSVRDGRNLVTRSTGLEGADGGHAAQRREDAKRVCAGPV